MYKYNFMRKSYSSQLGTAQKMKLYRAVNALQLRQTNKDLLKRQ